MQETFISYDNGRTYRRHMIPDEDDMQLYRVKAWIRECDLKIEWRKDHPVKYRLLKVIPYCVSALIGVILSLAGVV